MSGQTSLNVSIVGAGIAGLAAAIALRRAGHVVTIFEKSAFAREAGFAVSISPNGTRVLNSFGFDYGRAKALDCTKVEVFDARSLEALVEIGLDDHLKEMQAPWVVLFRPDLHQELLRLVFEDDGRTVVPTLKLSAKVVSVDIESATLTLEDGSTYAAELVVGADGEKSVVRSAEGFKGTGAVGDSPFKIFRCMIPTKEFEEDEVLRPFLDKKRQALSAYTDGIKIMTGELQDLELGYLRLDETGSPKDYKDEVLREALLSESKTYHPILHRALSKAKNVSSWDINFSTPPLHWTRGKAVLIGDAVHSMFPTTGQGACQCLEDAAALGVFLENLDSKADLAGRLSLFQSFRRKRVVAVHATSGFLPGQESRITEQMAKLLPGGKPLSSPVDTIELSNR
ncbi:FAD/NAD(P)-binding domain-containing protein [Canariomyces notabilis]|uniref:FAD/NAD(P)-binding domain-containing protein n=1 Tax=Canariomyces notabilis TaxID=2074819 RepID=A0AAN6YSV8_9PEZI|nr:FAD/NAD(P)-binding domain-containing protein [Canariomyces arenarius]